MGRARWSPSRPLAAGLAVAGVYLVVAVVTFLQSPRPFRPLFDGFAPPPPYRWVKPPPESARDNQQPVGATAELSLGPNGSPYANVTPDDAQAILTLQDAAVAPHPPDVSAHVGLTPLDSGTLGRLPSGLSPRSNAYQVEITYRPSETPVTSVVGASSSISLVGAGPTDVMLYSAEGKTWERRQPKPLGASYGLEAALAGPGYYVVASMATPSAATGISPLRAGLLAVPLILMLVAIAVRRRRRRARAAAAKAAAAATRRRAMANKQIKRKATKRKKRR